MVEPCPANTRNALDISLQELMYGFICLFLSENYSIKLAFMFYGKMDKTCDKMHRPPSLLLLAQLDWLFAT